MNIRKIQDLKAITREMFVQRATHANAEDSASPRSTRFTPPRANGNTLLNRQQMMGFTNL